MKLRRNRADQPRLICWRAAYGWEWQDVVDLDEIADFDVWVDAQHWLRLKVQKCTDRVYHQPRMRRNAEYRWTSPIGQVFCIWKVVQ